MDDDAIVCRRKQALSGVRLHRFVEATKSDHDIAGAVIACASTACLVTGYSVTR